MKKFLFALFLSVTVVNGAAPAVEHAYNTLYNTVSNVYSIFRLLNGTDSGVIVTNAQLRGATVFTNSLNAYAYPGTDNTVNGAYILKGLTNNSGGTIPRFVVVNLDTNGIVQQSDSDNSLKYPTMGITTESVAADAVVDVMLLGFARCDVCWDFIPGQPVYADIFPGSLTQSPTISAGATRQAVGWAVTADIVLFNFTPQFQQPQLNVIASLTGSTGDAMIRTNGSWAALPIINTATIGGTLGVLSNNIPRSLGTGGSTLQSSQAFIDHGTNSSQAYASVRIDGAGGNTDLNLFPESNGAFYLGPPADGAATGGNNRGSRAVDLQMSRSVNSQVASGARSFAAGASSTASGTESTALGFGVNVSGNQSGGIGNILTVSGLWAFSSGANNVSSAQGSTTSGMSAVADKLGQDSHAAGAFAVAGDAQGSRVVLRNSTASTTPTVLFLDGSSARLTIPANSTWAFKGRVIMRTATSTLASNDYDIEGTLERGVLASTTTLPYQQVLALHEDSAAATVALSADTTNGALSITVTAADSTATRWVAVVYITEVTFP